jgi:TetR/AcrR family transcriptional regulator, tetracycline repressor protein
MAVRERLSREAIVTAAIALADAEGLDAVTIRRLAQDQGVTPMALYWHFKDKELLLDGVAERLLAEVVVPEPRPGASWAEQLRHLLGAILERLRAHPALAQLVSTRMLGSEPGLRLSERAFALLREAGFDAEQRAQIGMHALHTMVMLVTSEPGRPLAQEADDALMQRMRTKKAALYALSPDEFPNVLSCAEPMTYRPSAPAYYGLGLDMLLAGVEGVRPAGHSGSGRTITT